MSAADERLRRLELAVGQLGAAMFGLNARRQHPELARLIAQWETVLAERTPAAPERPPLGPGRWLPVTNASVDVELRKAGAA